MAFARLLRSWCGTPPWAAASCPSSPTRPAPSAWSRSSAEVQDLRPRGPALHPGRRRPRPPLRRERLGSGPPGGHHRGRRDGGLHRRGHLLRHVGRAHDALLPLLLHVRLPAGRRPAVGPRRRPGPGIPARMHGRAHHPATARGSSTRTATRLLLASTVPSCAAYDPAFAYEMAAIVEDGIRRMTGPEPEDRFWYLTLYNENYPMPALPSDPATPSGSAWARSRACTASASRPKWPGPGSGTGTAGDEPPSCSPGPAWQAATEARACWRPTGASSRAVVGHLLQVAAGGRHLRRAWNRLHPGRGRARAVRHRAAGRRRRARSWPSPTSCGRCPTRCRGGCPRPFTSLGTDGFGRSDTRDVLRRFFEVDAAHVVVAVLHGLAAGGARPRTPWPTPSRATASIPAVADPWSS